jgi:hypothetical protein
MREEKENYEGCVEEEKDLTAIQRLVEHTSELANMAFSVADLTEHKVTRILGPRPEEVKCSEESVQPEFDLEFILSNLGSIRESLQTVRDHVTKL